MEKVFLNGEILDAENANVSVADSGFLYGMGLFETMRCTKGKVFALDDHLARLFGSAKALEINCPYDKDYIAEAIDKTLKANDLTEARCRLTITNGPMAGPDMNKPTLLISMTEFAAYQNDYYQKGVKVVLTDFRQNVNDPAIGHKTMNFFARLLALNIARKKQAAEAIWFTTDNRLAEGCVSNVFIVKDSVLCTPTAQTPILPGIARKTVLDIAGKEGIDFVEKDLFIADLLGADEVFLTNVIMKLLPAVGIEAHTVGDGKVGGISKKLLECYDRVLAEC